MIKDSISYGKFVETLKIAIMELESDMKNDSIDFDNFDIDTIISEALKEHELVQSYIDQSESSSNYSKSDKYSSNREKLEKLCLGDVTKEVIRQIQIDDVIDY